MGLQDLPQAIEPISVPIAAAPVEVEDRRRPRRLNQVSPHLISLLRRPSAANRSAPPLDIVDAASSDDDLAVARGLGVGLVLSVPLWAVIDLIVRAVLR